MIAAEKRYWPDIGNGVMTSKSKELGTIGSVHFAGGDNNFPLPMSEAILFLKTITKPFLICKDGAWTGLVRKRKHYNKMGKPKSAARLIAVSHVYDQVVKNSNSITSRCQIVHTYRSTKSRVILRIW